MSKAAEASALMGYGPDVAQPLLGKRHLSDLQIGWSYIQGQSQCQ